MPTMAQRVLFFLVMLFLASWHLDEGRNDNTMSRAASVASLVDRGTLEITAIHAVTGDKAMMDGRFHSDKAPLPTFAVLPFHWFAARVGLVGYGPEGTLGPGLLRLGGFICGSIPFALLITLLWKDLSRRTTTGPMPATLLATLPCFGSFLFVYSGTFYNHLPETLFTYLAGRAVVLDRPALAGVWSGAAFLCGSAMLLFPMVWAAQWLMQGPARRFHGCSWASYPVSCSPVYTTWP